VTASRIASGGRWSDDEFRAAISAYGRMLRAEVQGARLEKSFAIAQLMKEIPRTKSSIDYRMRNISAVLDELGRAWIEGYKPMRHYPHRLRELVDQEFR
jgi:hypothetical protein